MRGHAHVHGFFFSPAHTRRGRDALVIPSLPSDMRRSEPTRIRIIIIKKPVTRHEVKSKCLLKCVHHETLDESQRANGRQIQLGSDGVGARPSSEPRLTGPSARHRGAGPQLTAMFERHRALRQRQRQRTGAGCVDVAVVMRYPLSRIEGRRM